MYPTVSLPALLNRLSRLPGELEALAGNLASAPRTWWAHSFSYPLVNVREESDAFHVEADVPGLTQEQIEVSIRHGTELTLQGERKAHAGDNGTWHHQERGVGRFQRVLTLPAAVDADKIEARLEHGVLRLTLPKMEAVKPRRIPVQG
ncbi:MAG TPA: Hsp20/alpha crystallin family protein [Gemmataceae bacterium]|nr:Hsp20/alpha crystallin family protein [Gemmataceae bacterium]